MKKVYQYRYYSDGDSNNQPVDDTSSSVTGIKRQSLVTGAVFQSKMPILQLGVQSMPGVKFYVNGNDEPIIIGTTGIYELELNNGAEINSLSFNNESVKMITEASGYIIVDIIYEDGEEEE